MFETSFVIMCVGVCKSVRDINGSLPPILCLRNNFNNAVIWIPFKDFVIAILIKSFLKFNSTLIFASLSSVSSSLLLNIIFRIF